MLEQPLRPPGQAGQRSADDLIAFIRQDSLIDLGLSGDNVGQSLVILGQDHPLACRQAAQALIPSGRRQPGAHAIGILDPVDVLEQAQPGGLGDIGGIAFRELEIRGDGPDEPGELIDQTLPRAPVTGSSTTHKSRDYRGIKVFLEHPSPSIYAMRRPAARDLMTALRREPCQRDRDGAASRVLPDHGVPSTPQLGAGSPWPMSMPRSRSDGQHWREQRHGQTSAPTPHGQHK
jgi:hypothetical protein